MTPLEYLKDLYWKVTVQWIGDWCVVIVPVMGGLEIAYDTDEDEAIRKAVLATRTDGDWPTELDDYSDQTREPT